MKEGLQSKPLADMSSSHLIFIEYVLQSDSYRREYALRYLNTIHFLEELEHLLAIELFSLLTRDEVSLLCNLAAV